MHPTFIDENKRGSDTSESTGFEKLVSQSGFNLINCSDSVGAVGVGDGRALLGDIVAK